MFPGKIQSVTIGGLKSISADSGKSESSGALQVIFPESESRNEVVMRERKTRC